MSWPKTPAYHSPADLTGRTICFVDAASTSGDLVPTKSLMDVGCAQDSMPPSLLNFGQLEEGQLLPVWESGPIPEYQLTVNRESLGGELAAEIIAVIENNANIPHLVETGICDSAKDCVLPRGHGV